MNLLVDEVQRVNAGGLGQKPQSSHLHPDHRARPGVTAWMGVSRSSRGDSVRRQGDKAGIPEGRLLGLRASRSPPSPGPWAASSLPAAGSSLGAHVISLRRTQGLEGFAPSLWKQSVFLPERVSVPFPTVAGTCAVSPLPR